MGRDESLRRRKEFRRVYDLGTVHRSADLVVIVLPNEIDRARSAVVASRRVGGAVRRNRAKRLLREAHRRLRPAGGFRGLDIVLIARAGTPKRKSREIIEQLAGIYLRAGLREAHDAAGSGETTDF